MQVQRIKPGDVVIWSDFEAGPYVKQYYQVIGKRVQNGGWFDIHLKGLDGQDGIVLKLGPRERLYAFTGVDAEKIKASRKGG